MPQLMLPIFPKRLTYINELIGFENKDGRVYYYHGLLPVFSHDEGDLQSFRFIASQLVVCGNVSQIDISKAFGIPYVTIKRSVKLLKDEGPEGFFKKKKGRTAHVLTPDKMKKAQTLLDKGHNASQVGKKIDAKAPAIRKAIQAGKLLRKKLQENNEEKPVDPALKTKSERSIIDSQSNMGVACTRENERILASLGKLTEAIPIFKPNVDVKSAGVLLSLPALLANGLLQHTDEVFSLPNGYYGMQSLFIMLAIAVLLRNQSIEAIRYCDAGEMGKIVGLDRIPELKTLRAKIKILTKNDQPAKWSRKLAQHWLEDNPKLAGTLYIDGHERVYNGKTKLPKRYISRQKLCLRGVSDYWVNDALGQPFFVVSKVVNPGMLAVLREDIVPQLLEDVPNQPDEEEFKTNRYLSRFGIVFDREGYSPPFFKEMWKKHISCYTYRKYAKDDWPETEFINTEVVFPNGEKAEMELAERGIFYKAEKIWIREIRKLTETGHQTSIVTTDYSNNAEMIGGTMFSRWSQENFFKYMMKHFGIDRLIEYGVEKIDETIKVVNPTYRNLDYQIRSLNGKLSRQKAEYGDIIFKKEIEEKEVKDYIQKKSELIECMENMKQKIEKLKAKRKKAGKHIAISELPEDQQFDQLKKGGKQFIDTIKMIAYRAETSVVNIVREYSHKKDEARSIVRQMFETDADVLPDEENGILNVRIHNMSNPRDNRCVEQVCKVLNESETIFPGTNLRLFFDLVSNQIHAVPEF